MAVTVDAKVFSFSTRVFRFYYEISINHQALTQPETYSFF
jgi:hypothetical protein